MRFVFICIIIWSLNGYASRSNRPYLEVFPFERGGESYYAVVFTEIPPSDSVKNERADVNYRSQSVSIEDLQAYKRPFYTLYHLIYGDDVSLFRAPDFISAMKSDHNQWRPFDGDPLQSGKNANQFERNIFDMIVSYANHYKWENYADRDTLPSQLDPAQIRQSPLIRPGMMAVLILDGQKNFAGLVSMAYPTKTHPLLPVQELHNDLVRKHPEQALPELLNPLDMAGVRKASQMPEISYRGPLVPSSIDPFDGDFRKTRALMGEILSYVKNPRSRLDIMTVSQYLLDRFGHVAAPFPSRINNNFNVSSEWLGPGGLLFPGVYSGKCSSRLFKLYKRWGWQHWKTVGDTVFILQSRADYLAMYHKGLATEKNGTSLQSDLLRSSILNDRRDDPRIFDPYSPENRARAAAVDPHRVLWDIHVLPISASPSEQGDGRGPYSCRALFRL